MILHVLCFDYTYVAWIVRYDIDTDMKILKKWGHGHKGKHDNLFVSYGYIHYTY